MKVLDYSAFRDRLVQAFTTVGLQGIVDEVVFLNSNSRGCEVLVHPGIETGELWGKVSFEWAAMNQALLEEVVDDEVDLGYARERIGDSDGEVVMHSGFHLHFPDYFLTADAARGAAEEMKRLGESLFGDEGGVVAEVSMTSADARLECLRFEVSHTAPFITDEPWWIQFAEIVRDMLDQLGEIAERLRLKHDSSRGSSE